MGVWVGAWVWLGGWYVCVRCEYECMWHVCVWCVSMWVQEEKGGGGNLWFTVNFVFKYSDTCRDH